LIGSNHDGRVVAAFAPRFDGLITPPDNQRASEYFVQSVRRWPGRDPGDLKQLRWLRWSIVDCGRTNTLLRRAEWTPGYLAG
jgi:hypothetical protein